MASKSINTDLAVTGTVDATALTVGGVPTITSAATDVTNVVESTQAAYDALGPGRPATRLYLITG